MKRIVQQKQPCDCGPGKFIHNVDVAAKGQTQKAL